MWLCGCFYYSGDNILPMKRGVLMKEKQTYHLRFQKGLFAEHIRKDIVKLEVGNNMTVLCAILLCTFQPDIRTKEGGPRFIPRR